MYIFVQDEFDKKTLKFIKEKLKPKVKFIVSKVREGPRLEDVLSSIDNIDELLRDRSSSEIFLSIDGISGQGHSTLIYDDGYRFSKNFPGEHDKHWTNQSERKKSRKRHKPPKDLKKS